MIHWSSSVSNVNHFPMFQAYERTFQNLLLLDLNSTGPTKNKRTAVENRRGGSDNRDYELTVFSFTNIIAATDNISARNRLGEGGFGPVYKIMLLTM